MDDVTAEEIGRLREEAERERASKSDEPRKKAKKKPKKKKPKKDRVTVETRDDGGVITIAPSKGWRDREMALGLLSVPLVIVLVLGVALGGGAGFLIALAFTVGLIALILVTSVGIRIRWTSQGDCIVYKRDPRRPMWAGRCAGLEIETTVTQRNNKSLAYVRFDGRMLPYYPLTDADTRALFEAARAAGIRKKDTRWGSPL